MRPKVFIAIVLAATLLGACDRSHDPEVMWSGEILLSSGVTAHTRVNDAKQRPTGRAKPSCSSTEEKFTMPLVGPLSATFRVSMLNIDPPNVKHWHPQC